MNDDFELRNVIFGPQSPITEVASPAMAGLRPGIRPKPGRQGGPGRRARRFKGNLINSKHVKRAKTGNLGDNRITQ
jgi:hypothetical protein